MLDHEPQAMLRTAEDWAAASREPSTRNRISLRPCAAACRLAFLMRTREAEERVRRVWTESHRRVLPRVMLDSGYWLGKFLLEQGRLSEAEEVAGEVDDLAATRRGCAPRAEPRSCEFTLQCRHASRPCCRGASPFRARRGRRSNVHHQIGLYQDLAVWPARMGGEGKRQDVVARLDAARRSADAVACRRCSAELLLMSAEALARVGHPAEAQAALAAWDALELRPQPHERFLRRRVQALLEVRRGDTDSAVAALEAAQAEAERLQLVVEGLWTRLDLASVPRSHRSEPCDRDAAGRSRARRRDRVADAAGPRGAEAPCPRCAHLAAGAGGAQRRSLVQPDRARARGRAPGGERRAQPRYREDLVPVAEDRRASASRTPFARSARGTGPSLPPCSRIRAAAARADAPR